jgi:type I restriction enzyme S subunit
VIRRWREIERWIENGTGPQRISGFPLLPLGDLVVPRHEPVRVNGVLGDWQAITIKFSGEVLPRERAEAFKGAMFAAYPGDLVFSKIDARNGAVGLIPDSIPKAVVTSEYPAFTPKDRLRAGYLHHLLRADHFKAELQRKASGTSGRKRITPEGFLSLEVPVPTLAEQDALIAAYTEALHRATHLEQEAEAIEQAGWQAFETALGVAPSPPLPDRPVFVARFKDVERWSHEGILRTTLGETGVQVASCPLVELGSVAAISYGLQKCPANRPGTHARPYLRVANVQRGRLALDEIKTINVPDSEMASLRLEVGDLLFVEGNGSRAELGRVAFWNGEIADCVHQNHIIKARPKTDRLLPEFAMAWFNSEAGRDHFFKSGKTTSGLGTINSTVIRTAPIPLPPIETQQDWVAKLSAMHSEADAKRAKATTLRQSAWVAFESALFTASEETPA